MRVCLFTDSYNEVNGVAHTIRHFEQYALRSGLPLMLVHRGPKTEVTHTGSVTRLQLECGPVHVDLDRDLRHDLLFWRHRGMVRHSMRLFDPDVVHITGPSDCGQMGAFLAKSMKLPLVASWHTNLHEFAGRRVAKYTRWIPKPVQSGVVNLTEASVWKISIQFYRLARILFAPNPELAELLTRDTGRKTFLMRRGIDTGLFTPARRRREDTLWRIGYVGRLSPEKNVRLLAKVDEALTAAGRSDYRFMIVGDGSERPWLERNLKHAGFTGVLRGEDLAAAYAGMDVFAFPSETDTFGNVILEAMASAVPAVVMNSGGPRFLVEHGVTGYISEDSEAFVRNVVQIVSDRERHGTMRESAETYAAAASWDAVFDGVVKAYQGAVVSSSQRSRLQSTCHETGRSQ